MWNSHGLLNNRLGGGVGGQLVHFLGLDGFWEEIKWFGYTYLHIFSTDKVILFFITSPY